MREGKKNVTINARMNNIFWTGYSNNERLSSISAKSSIVSRFGDMVVYKLFSDISLTMTIEMEEAKINSLHDNLKDIVGMDVFEYINTSSFHSLANTVALAIISFQLRGMGN